MISKSEADRFKTAPQTKAEMLIEHGLSVSNSTARRRLRQAGLFGHKPGGNRAQHLTIKRLAWPLQGHTKIGQQNSVVSGYLQ